MDSKLGRGLSSLLGEDISGVNNMENLRVMDLEKIFLNKDQPRKYFDQEKLEELSNSIAQHGILQPLVVRKLDEDLYELLAGERRYRAAQMAGIATVPVHVIECDDASMFALALIENIQREDLNPIEESDSYIKLINDYQYTQENLSKILNKSRSHIANLMRLKDLNDCIRGYIRDNKLTLGHAKCLMGRLDAQELAEQVVTKKLSVRDLEKLINNKRVTSFYDDVANGETRVSKNIEYDVYDISQRVSEALESKADLRITSNGGVLTIRFNSFEKLEYVISGLLEFGENAHKE